VLFAAPPFSRDAERSATRQLILHYSLTSTRKNALRYEFVGCVGTWGNAPRDEFSASRLNK